MKTPDWLSTFTPNPPAAQDAVDTLQKAVGHKLPPDYRAFLLASDGASTVGDIPIEFFPAARVLQETLDAGLPDTDPALFLIGRVAEGCGTAGGGIVLDCRPPKFCYATCDSSSGATEYRGTTLARMLQSIAAGKPVPEPKTLAAKIKQDPNSHIELVREFGVSKDWRVTALAVRGDFALTGSMTKPVTRLWNWRTGEQLLEVKTKRTGAWGASISHDNRLGIIWYIDYPYGFQVLDLKTAAILSTVNHGPNMAGAAFASNTEIVCVNWEGLITAHDVATAAAKRQFQGLPESREMDVSGNILGVNSNQGFRLYDIPSLTPLGESDAMPVPSDRKIVAFGGSPSVMSTGTARHMGFNGAYLAGGRLYAAPQDAILDLFDTQTNQLVSHSRGRAESFWHVRTPDDGTHLVTCGDSSGLIRVWTTHLIAGQKDAS